MTTHSMPGAASCRITVNGTAIEAEPGISIAAALVRNGHQGFSRDKAGHARGVFCGMGACHDCLVTVNGRTGQRACMVPVEPDMRIEDVAAKPVITDDTLHDLAALPKALPVHETELAIVGAGPAGLAAARTAAAKGIVVTLLDERPKPGGQFYKQPIAEAVTPDAQAREGADLINDLRDDNITLRSQTLTWGAQRNEDGRIELCCLDPNGAFYLKTRMLVIATGAYENPEAVPGWTLPGTMTVGAAQTLVRAYGTIPGKRIVVAGNGPLNLQVANEINRLGGKVVAVVEAAASPFTRPVAATKLLSREPAMAQLGMRQLMSLQLAGTKLHFRSRINEVLGDSETSGVRITTPGGTRDIEADCVLMGGRFVPDNTLSRLLGCAHDMVDGQLVARRAPDGESSEPDIHIIGEAGRFAGAQVALAEGELAGKAVATKLRGTSEQTQRAARRRKKALGFQAALWELYRADAKEEATPDDTPLCRCELVLKSELIAATRHGRHDVASLKRLTRAGMGRCQGRYCAERTAKIANPETKPNEKTRALAPQMPTRPVPLAALAVEKGEWGGHKRSLLPERPAFDAQPLNSTKTDIAIMGGGIAGVSTALFLARAGHEVTLLEHGRVNSLASGGNAGSLHAQLLSFDHGARAEGGGGPAARTLPLQKASIDLWGILQQELHADFEMKITGGLMVAETADHMAFLKDKTSVERSVGVDAEVISQVELRDREPALDERFVGAAWCPHEGKINPLVATQHLLDAALSLGVRLEELTSVQAISRENDGFTITTSRGALKARRVVNAAGGFASQIGQMLDCPIPVFGAPLQMVVTEAAAPTISSLVAHADRHLTLKQATNGNFIIGGGWTAALDPVHQHPRPLTSSLEGNLWVAQHVVPGLRKLHVIRSWAAMNINIDGAPILGEDPRCKGLFHAVTSNGYTLGPIMGQLTAALVAGTDPGRDLTGFSLARFD